MGDPMILFAAQATAAAESFVAGRSDATDLGQWTDRISIKVALSPDAEVTAAMRLLLVAMRHTSTSTGERLERWRDIMSAMTRMVRHEAVAMS